jgi:hypothetical protein
MAPPKTYLRFVARLPIHAEARHYPRKTGFFDVVNAANDVLGWIYWKNSWRRYIFEPRISSAFDASCLEDVIHELRRLMAVHKQDMKTPPPA